MCDCGIFQFWLEPKDKHWAIEVLFAVASERENTHTHTVFVYFYKRIHTYDTQLWCGTRWIDKTKVAEKIHSQKFRIQSTKKRKQQLQQQSIYNLNHSLSRQKRSNTQ